MRFQRIYNNFGRYSAEFFAARPELTGQPYAEQQAALLHDSAERADFYERVLRQQYGYETDTLIADAEPLQKQWAREHGVHYNDATWTAEIALAQVRAFQPEVLWSSSWMEAFGPAFVRRCREVCPSLRLVLGWVGESHPPAAFFREHDVVLSCAPDTVAFLASEGVAARHLNHGFDPLVLDRLRVLPPPEPADVGFIGNLHWGDQYHNTRIQMFFEMARRMDFALYGWMSGLLYKKRGPVRWLRRGYYGILEAFTALHLEPIARAMPRHDAWVGIKAREPFVPLFAYLDQRRRPPVYGLEMYRTLAGFEVGLNVHGPSAYASNMRLYDTTGVGTCLLTDWKDNLPQLFEPGVEVVAYHSPDEAVEKARWLLDHDDERRAIAAAGQRRTLRDHTTERRVEVLHGIIHEFLRGRQSR